MDKLTDTFEKMDDNQFAIYERLKQNTNITMVLWLFLGGLGTNHFYLGNIGGAVVKIIFLSLSIVGGVLHDVEEVLYDPTLGSVFIWSFLIIHMVDMCLIPYFVKHANFRIAEKILIRKTPRRLRR